jgi:hypothetical protein
MVFSAEFFDGAALVAVGVAEDAVDDSVVDEQPAINATMHAASPAMRLGYMVTTTASACVHTLGGRHTTRRNLRRQAMPATIVGETPRQITGIRH